MKNIRHLSAGTKPRKTGRAFTLVEMLVVIFIILILVAMVVAVSKYLQEKSMHDTTVSRQRVILDAIQAFYSQNNYYPASMAPASVQPVKPVNIESLYYAPGEWEALWRIRGLYTQLTDPVLGAASKAKLANLPAEAVCQFPRAMYRTSDMPTPAPTVYGQINDNTGATYNIVNENTILDAWNHYMDYRSDGGKMGQLPTIISGGPDKMFSTTADNIQSD